MNKRPTHPMAGKTVTLKNNKGLGLRAGQQYRIEDWWENVSGRSWKSAQRNPACIAYAARTLFSPEPIPHDDEVVYGKTGGLGHLIHVSEINEEAKP